MKYPIASPTFSFFDSDGVTPVLDSAIQSVTTPGNIVGMTTDQYCNVYVIDHNHILRRYTRTGASYTEYITAPFPLDLAPIIGTNTGTGVARRLVQDLAMNWHNGAFYIYTEHAADSYNDGFLYRVDCDGTFNPNLTGPGTNPRNLNASYTSNPGTGTIHQADILIDHWTQAGAYVGAQEDVQMYILATAFTPQPNHYAFNPNLGIMAQANSNTGIQSGAVIISNNGLIVRNGLSMANCHYYTTPPIGWQ